MYIKLNPNNQKALLLINCKLTKLGATFKH